jgi:hypothetical protein
LAVAGEIGETERPVVEHAQDALWSAAMLDVRLAVGAGGGEIEGALLGDEGGKLLVDRGGEPALRLHLRIAGAGAAALLHGLDRG